MKRKKRNPPPYQIREIADGVYQIEEYGVYCYLLVGAERALLIDTGTGFGDLAACVRTLTDLPLTVAATHAHPDHIGGRGSFPALWLDAKDRGLARFYGTLAMRRLMFGKKAQRRYGVGRGAILPARHRTAYLPFGDGHTFDLGGRTVTAVETPGHTKGHCVFLAGEDRLMFAGDDVCRALWMFLPGSTTVEDWIAGAERIARLAQTYVSYDAHSREPSDPEIIVKLIASARALVASTPNARLPKIRVYPEAPVDHGILYRTTRVRNRKPRSRAGKRGPEHGAR